MGEWPFSASFGHSVFSFKARPALSAVQLNSIINGPLNSGVGGAMFWDMAGDIGPAQVVQGISGAAAAYPVQSLIHHIADALERLSPK